MTDEPLSGQQVRQTIVASQLKGGFIDLLRDARALFPYSTSSQKVTVFLDSDDTTPVQVNLTGWRYNTPMLTGLTAWFRRNNAKVGDRISIERLEEGKYRLKFIYQSTMPADLHSGNLTSDKSEPSPLNNDRDRNERHTFLPSNHRSESNQPFIVDLADNEVKVWSTVRLPFEPKGSMLELRQKIRSSLLALCGRFRNNRSTALYALYSSNSLDRVDVENVLFYNVGPQYFSKLYPSVIIFERRFAHPPAPPDGQPTKYHHFHHYSIETGDVNRSFSHWRPTRTLARFTFPLGNHALNAIRLEHVWYGLKNGQIQIVDRPTPGELRSNRFGLRLFVKSIKEVKADLPQLTKILIDGVVCAFQKDESVDDSIAKVISVRVNQDISKIQELLKRDYDGILGSDRLVHAWGNSIQWNPKDDGLVAAKLVSSEGSDALQVSGELFFVEPVNSAN